MNAEIYSKQVEVLTESNEAMFTRPAGLDLYFAGFEPTENLPDNIVHDPRLFKQAKTRRELYDSFNQVFTKIPDPLLNIKDALESGLVDRQETGRLYDGISNFLEQDENNARLILYLPFEILPDLTEQASESQAESSGKRFADIYRQSWVRLLHEIDPRASFTDGDVLEPGLPEPEYISKAGHLTPEILNRGIIDAEDIISLLEIIEDPRIVKSLAEGATVAKDSGLVSNLSWQKITEIIDKKLQGIDLGPIKYDESSFTEVSPERKKWLEKVNKEKEGDAQSGAELNNQKNTLETNTIDLSSTFLSVDFEKDFKPTIEATKIIQNDPVLSQVLYPTFLVFGSRLKGYADTDADFDAAIFFKSNTNPESRDQILERLFKLVPDLKIDNLLEYWMKEEDGELDFETLPENSSAIGYDQVHFFMGGAWISQGEEHKRIYADILNKYLDLSRFGDQKEDKRLEFLGRIELDVLQYRLMHKGYRKFYPSNKKQGSRNAHLIDWESDFWDSGYRRVATRLFLSRVFLPDLS